MKKGNPSLSIIIFFITCTVLLKCSPPFENNYKSHYHSILQSHNTLNDSNIKKLELALLLNKIELADSLLTIVETPPQHQKEYNAKWIQLKHAISLTQHKKFKKAQTLINTNTPTHDHEIIRQEFCVTNAYIKYKTSHPDSTLKYIASLDYHTWPISPLSSYQIARLNLIKARCNLFGKHNLEEALSILTKVIETINTNYVENILVKSEAYYYSAIINRNLNNYVEAISNCRHSIILYTQHDAKYMLAHTYIELGNIFLNSEYKSYNSIKYYEKADSLSKYLNNTYINKIIKDNTAVAYANLSQYDRSNTILLSSLNNARAQDSLFLISNLLHNAKYSNDTLNKNIVNNFESSIQNNKKPKRIIELAEYYISHQHYGRAASLLKDTLINKNDKHYTLYRCKTIYTKIKSGTHVLDDTEELNRIAQSILNPVSATSIEDIHEITINSQVFSYILASWASLSKKHEIENTLNSLYTSKSSHPNPPTISAWCKKHDKLISFEIFLLDGLLEIGFYKSGIELEFSNKPNQLNNGNTFFKIQYGEKPLKLKWSHLTKSKAINIEPGANFLDKSPSINLDIYSEIAIFGFASSPKSELRNTFFEAMFLDSLYQNSTLQLGRKFSKQTLRKYFKYSKIIHISTHGHTSEWDVSKNHLVLPGSADDFIDINFVSDLNGKPEIVFLNTCHEFNGLYIDGLGFKNIAQAFINAGAKFVVFPNSNISDHQARINAEIFYKKLIQDSKSALEFIVSNNYNVYL